MDKTGNHQKFASISLLLPDYPRFIPIIHELYQVSTHFMPIIHDLSQLSTTSPNQPRADSTIRVFLLIIYEPTQLSATGPGGWIWDLGHGFGLGSRFWAGPTFLQVPYVLQGCNRCVLVIILTTYKKLQVPTFLGNPSENRSAPGQSEDSRIDYILGTEILLNFSWI